jgi:hypothetical protein
MLCGQSSIDDLENALFSGRKHLSVDRQGDRWIVVAEAFGQGPDVDTAGTGRVVIMPQLVGSSLVPAADLRPQAGWPDRNGTAD